MTTNPKAVQWLRPAQPAMRALEAQRQWLISLAQRPLYAFFGKNRDDTIRLQRRAKLRRFLRSRTLDQLDAIIVDPMAPEGLRLAARQHRKYRDQIVTTTTIRRRANPQLPVRHRASQTVIETMRPHEGAYKSDPHVRPVTVRLGGVEIAKSLIQRAVHDQRQIAEYLFSLTSEQPDEVLPQCI